MARGVVAQGGHARDDLGRGVEVVEVVVRQQHHPPRAIDPHAREQGVARDVADDDLGLVDLAQLVEQRVRRVSLDDDAAKTETISSRLKPG